MKYSVRSGRKGDLEAVAELLIESWRVNYIDLFRKYFLDNLSLQHQKERHLKYFNNGIKYFIAEDDENKLIGFSSIGKDRNENTNCQVELYTLYVHQNYHKRGIGKQLLSAILTEVNDLNSNISVVVFKKNKFKKFYLKNNFTKLKEETQLN